MCCLRMFRCAGLLALLLAAGCTAEGGSIVSEAASANPMCRDAPTSAITAIRTKIKQEGVLVNAHIVKVPPADQGFGQYPAFIIAARFVSPHDETPIALWALGSDTTYNPIYPVDSTAAELTAPDMQTDSFLATHINDLDDTTAASTARTCAANDQPQVSRGLSS